MAASPGWTRSAARVPTSAPGASSSRSRQPSEISRIDAVRGDRGQHVAGVVRQLARARVGGAAGGLGAVARRQRGGRAAARGGRRRSRASTSARPASTSQADSGSRRARRRARSAPASAVRTPRAAGATAVARGHPPLVGQLPALAQMSRSSAAACSGAVVQRFTPAPSSSPARWVSRGRMSIRQQKWSAPEGAVRTHRFSGGLAPSRRAQAAEHVVQQRGAERAVVLEARPRAARGDHELVRDARRVRRHRHRLVVDRDDAVAPADLLLHEVAEQVAAHRARRVGGEALALAGDRGGHEAQRVELGVGVRERGAGLAALVDDQVPARAVRRARACARARPPSRSASCVGLELDERVDHVGRVDDHLVVAGGRLRGVEVRVGVRLGLVRVGGQRRVQVRARRGRSSPACPARRRRAARRRPRAASGPRGRARTGPWRRRSGAAARGRSGRRGGRRGRRR